MHSKKITNIKTDFIRNNLLNSAFLSKNNIDSTKKTYENQPYNEYINLNPLINNQISLGEYTLSTSERTRNNKEDNSKEFTLEKSNSQYILIRKNNLNLDSTFLYNLFFHNLTIKQYRNYIYFIQKTFNRKIENLKNIILNKAQHNNNNDNYIKEIKLLENLIARYSIIIFYLVKQKLLYMAKNIFLLMMKENIIYIKFFEKNIYKEFFRIEYDNKLINHGYPKSILNLIKIYAIILKYSLLFNLTKNRDIFLSKYLSLQYLNYKVFILKSEVRGPSMVTDIAIKYIYANCLFNSCYYSIRFFTPMIVPIKLSELIFKIYEGMNEVIFEKKEKSLLLKTSFNYALFVYLNGNNDLALTQLELIKDKLITFYEFNDCDDDEQGNQSEETNIDDCNNDKSNGINNKENNNNVKENKSYKNIFKKRESKKKLSVTFREKILVKRQETMKKLERKRGLSRSQNTIDKIKEILFNKKNNKNDTQNYINISRNLFDPLHQVNYNKYNGFTQKKILKIDDIKKFFISDAKTVLNKKNRKCSITERDIKNKQKFENNYGVSNKNTLNNNSTQSIVDLRSSHINFSSLFKINKLNLPKYFTDSLLIETELLMCEIGLDSKNINYAYEHFKNSILILFISKQNTDPNDVNALRDFRKKLCIISEYLKEINKYIDEKNKKNKFQVIKNTIKSCKTFKSLSKKKSFNDKSLLKKVSLRIGKNHLVECIDLNMNKNNSDRKGDEYYNELLNKKLEAEIEKFFIFLNSLSIYQIKLLNDTQPKREIRNDLPILFNGQFKDSLTTGQRNTLRNLHTMSISRNMILNDPDKLILPTNLKFSALNYNKENIENNKYKLMKSIKNQKIYNKAINISNSKEYNYFKRIIISKKINKELQQFLLDNYSLVMKILKELDKNEINDIVKNLHILVEPINSYKKKQSKSLKKNWTNCNYLLKIKDLKELKKLIFKLSNFKEEKNNKKNVEDNENKILFESDSENNKSISLSVDNSSFYNNE